MLRLIQLLILGYLISRWGGFRINLRNRLQLLKDVTVFSNPRFGIDRTINAVLESLRAFYDADSALLLVAAKSGAESYQMYRIRRGSQATGASPPVIGSGGGGFVPPAFATPGSDSPQRWAGANVIFRS